MLIRVSRSVDQPWWGPHRWGRRIRCSSRPGRRQWSALLIDVEPCANACCRCTGAQSAGHTRPTAESTAWNFPGTFHNHDPPAKNTTALPGPVHRAGVFIDEHLAHPLGLAEIAAATRLSPRQLLFAFRQHLGTIPGTYLRTARLDAAHHDLLATVPSQGATAAAIA